MNKTGKLYIVATPIGNLDDITIRAIRILREADAVICEERRQGSTLLKRLDITPNELIALNEHNEKTASSELVNRILMGESMALFSDAGTPVFADPGAHLIQQAAEMGVQVMPIPGPSSLMAALSILDFKIDQFMYGGFLPRNPEQRRQELTRLRGLRLPVILLDTPYRLTALLEDIAKIFGKNQRLTLAFNLTLPGELIVRGNPAEVLKAVGPRKGEFVLIIH